MSTRDATKNLSASSNTSFSTSHIHFFPPHAFLVKVPLLSSSLLHALMALSCLTGICMAGGAITASALLPLQ